MRPWHTPPFAANTSQPQHSTPSTACPPALAAAPNAAEGRPSRHEAIFLLFTCLYQVGEVRDAHAISTLLLASRPACANPMSSPGSWPDRVLSMQHAPPRPCSAPRANERLPANILSEPASCDTTSRHEQHLSPSRSAVPGPMHGHAFSMQSLHARYRGGGSVQLLAALWHPALVSLM